MLEKEMKRISEVTKLNPDEFSIPSGIEPYRHVMKKREGKCVFLKGTNCQIYLQRPLPCRFYPFWLEKLGAGSFEFKVAEECPGIGRGSIVKKSEFKNMLREALRALTS
jgi:Fe-S-cluster containining protein